LLDNAIGCCAHMARVRPVPLEKTMLVSANDAIGPSAGAEGHRAADVPDAPAATIGKPSMDRRNADSRNALVRRVLVEFEEMPGMRLTQAQAQRLFGLRTDICARVLAALVEQAALRRDSNGAYVLDGHHP
jgi:hypothetical protein